MATARSLKTMLSRVVERCKAAGARLNFHDGLKLNGHKPCAVKYDGHADVVACSKCGQHVRAKKKTIVQPCTEHLSEGGRRAVDRISQVMHPDRTNCGRVSACWDAVAR